VSKRCAVAVQFSSRLSYVHVRSCLTILFYSMLRWRWLLDFTRTRHVLFVSEYMYIYIFLLLLLLLLLRSIIYIVYKFFVRTISAGKSVEPSTTFDSTPYTIWYYDMARTTRNLTTARNVFSLLYKMDCTFMIVGHSIIITRRHKYLTFCT